MVNNSAAQRVTALIPLVLTVGIVRQVARSTTSKKKKKKVSKNKGF